MYRLLAFGFLCIAFIRAQTVTATNTLSITGDFSQCSIVSLTFNGINDGSTLYTLPATDASTNTGTVALNALNALSPLDSINGVQSGLAVKQTISFPVGTSFQYAIMGSDGTGAWESGIHTVTAGSTTCLSSSASNSTVMGSATSSVTSSTSSVTNSTGIVKITSTPIVNNSSRSTSSVVTNSASVSTNTVTSLIQTIVKTSTQSPISSVSSATPASDQNKGTNTAPQSTGMTIIIVFSVLGAVGIAIFGMVAVIRCFFTQRRARKRGSQDWGTVFENQETQCPDDQKTERDGES